jgi:hypothetical protein
VNRKAKTQLKKLLQSFADYTLHRTTSQVVYPQVAVTLNECGTCEDPVGMANTLRELAKLVK